MNKQKVISILSALCFCDEEITDEMLLNEDLGLDSLNLVELIVKLEDDFEIQFDESDLDPEQLRTVEDIYMLIRKYKEDSDAI